MAARWRVICMRLRLDAKRIAHAPTASFFTLQSPRYSHAAFCARNFQIVWYSSERPEPCRVQEIKMQAIRMRALLAAAVGSLLTAVTADAADKVRFQTDWLPSGE